jgi:ATP-dependent protease HslVU (ClpYQ) peptidase subunit
VTCIVGLAKDGEVTIGGDSAGSNNWQLTVRKDAKVFPNGDFLIGAGTSFRMIQLLRYSLIPPVYEKPLHDNPEYLSCYMATSFVDSVRECLKNGGWAKKEAEQESGGVFLVGFQGRLFCINSDYQVEETLCGYNAIGDGDDVALGSLYTTGEFMPHNRVELALQAAEYHCSTVRGPFIIESV